MILMKCKAAIEELHNELDEVNKIKSNLESKNLKLEKELFEKESQFKQEKSIKDRLEGN